MANSRTVIIAVCFYVFGIVYLTTCVPIEDGFEEGDKNETNDDYILIDQRQNGSENYRINIDGVIIAFSPLESLLSGALDDFDFGEDLDFAKPDGHKQNSTEAVSKPVVNGGNSVVDGGNSVVNGGNATAAGKHSGKVKRRRFHTVSGLMRSILHQRRIAGSKKE